MKRIARPLAWSLAAWCVIRLGAETAEAQGQPDQRITAGARLGPAYLNPSISLEDMGVDTNVFRDDPGQEQSDFTYTVAPDVDLFVPLGKGLVELDSAFEFVYFSQLETERSVNADLRLRGELALHPVTLFAETSYLNTRERLGFEIDARARRVENALEAGVIVAVLPLLDVQASARASRREFDDATFEGSSLAARLNRNSETAIVALSYSASPLTTILVSTELERTRFPLGPEKDFDSFRIVPGVRFEPLALIAGQAEVGYRRFGSRDPVAPDFRGLVADVDLTYSAPSATRLRFTASRDLEDSFELTEPFYIRDSYRVDVRQRIASSAEVGVGTSRHALRYQEIGAVPASDLTGGRVDTIQSTSALVGFRLPDGTRTEVRVAFIERRSLERPSRNYRSWQIGVSVTYDF